MRLLVLLLLGCTQADTLSQLPIQVQRYEGVAPSYSDYRAVPYLQEFHKLTGLPIDKVPVIVDETGEFINHDRTAAVCTLDQNKNRVILVSLTYWDYGPQGLTPGSLQSFRELVIYHELGHCLLYRDHDEETAKGLPLSIMYPIITNDMVNLWNDPKGKQYYIKELLDGRLDTQLLP